MKAVASRYNVVVDVDGHSWGFQGRTGALVRFDAHTKELLLQAEDAPILVDDRHGPLLQAGFLVPVGVSELAMLRRLFYGSAYGSSRLDLVIAPTLDCNLACSYCFQGGPPPERMTKDVAEAVVALAARRLPELRELRVTWYGGEPLLEPDMVTSLQSQLNLVAAECGVRVSAQIITNGTLLTSAVAQRLRLCGITSAQVTIDGPSEVHDRRRVLRSGGETWRLIMDNVAAARTDLAISVRVTVGMGEAEHAWSLCQALDEFGLPPEVTVRPAPIHQTSCRPDCRSETSFVADLLGEVGRRGRPQRLLLPWPEVAPLCLGSSSRGFLVAPDGSVHLCLETAADPSRRVGHLLTDMSFSPELGRWMDADPFWSRSACLDCTTLPQCFGGCPNAYLKTGLRHCVGFKDLLVEWVVCQARHPAPPRSARPADAST